MSYSTRLIKLLRDLDSALKFSIEVEGRKKLEDVENYDEVDLTSIYSQPGKSRRRSSTPTTKGHPLPPGTSQNLPSRRLSNVPQHHDHKPSPTRFHDR